MRTNARPSFQTGAMRLMDGTGWHKTKTANGTGMPCPHSWVLAGVCGVRRAERKSLRGRASPMPNGMKAVANARPEPFHESTDQVRRSRVCIPCHDLGAYAAVYRLERGRSRRSEISTRR